MGLYCVQSTSRTPRKLHGSLSPETRATKGENNQLNSSINKHRQQHPSSNLPPPKKEGSKCLRALSTDAASELDVLGHNGDPLGVDGAQVGVLEETNKVSLSSLLKGKDGRSLEPQVGLEVLGDLADQPLERKLPDQKLGTLLVPADLAKGDGSGAVPVRLLDSSGSRGRLPGSLGGELLPGGLASGGLACGLLGSGHFDLF
jgi:hypothetical protein